MESEHKKSNNGRKYSSTMETPLINEELHCMSKPLVLKLSGEAPDAYNEAYEELFKVDESKEDAPFNINQNNHQEELHKFDAIMSWGDQYAANISDATFPDQVRTLEEQLTSRVRELPGVDVSEDECRDCDDDDEMEKLLIHQIVEKAKKGSPALLNAQRILFSLDEI